jgi:hypothetical protein
MAKGISINFLADVRDFLKGTKNVEDELDTVADTLDDVAKEGDQSTEKLEKSFKELADAAKKSGDDIEKGISQGTKRGAQDAENATDVLKKEAIANLSEVTSSFDGSITSLAQGIQGTLGGIVQDLGPLGIAAGALGAAGVGLLIKAYEDANEEVEAAKIRVAELGKLLIDTGANGEIPIRAIADNFKEIAVNSDDARRGFKDIKEEAEDLGLEVGALATAYAGGTEELESQLGALDDLLKAERDNQKASFEGTKEFDKNSAQKITDIIEQQVELGKVADEIKLAQEAEEAWLKTGGAEMLAKADAIDTINASYDEAVYAVDDFKDAESGIYDLDAYAQSIRDREQLLMDYQTSLAESGLTTEQKTALNEMGIEQAQAILNGLKNPGVSEETKKTIKNGLKTASQEGSGVAKKEIEEAFKKPVDAKVKVIADTEAARVDLDNLIKARTAIIKVDFRDARTGKQVAI